MSRETQFPIGASLTLNDLENDVHTFMHMLRQHEPISWIPVLDAWLVTGRDLTVEMMRDAKTFTVDHPGFSTAQVVGSSMLSLDGAEHLKHRGPFERPFRKREVEQRFREPVAHHVDQLINTFKPNGKAELRRDYAGPVAVYTMITALGLAQTSVTAVLGWYDSIVEAVTRVSTGESVSEEGKAAFSALKQSLLPSLKSDPKSSLLAAAGGMAQGLTDDQIVSNAAVLLFGGIETTEGMIANALYHLLTHPTALAEVQTDLSLIPNVVEESLRLEPAASVIDRYTVTDVQLGEVTIKEGDLVRLSLCGANRDPNYFENPDQFNPHRPNLHEHVTFAQGPHVCLGIHLARLEAQYAIQQAITQLPNLRLDESANNEMIMPRGLIFRKPQALPVRWKK